MSPFTPVLIEYWQKLPVHPTATRRLHVADTCRRVRAGELPVDALIPYALGDIDDTVVFEAAAAYVGVSGPADRSHESAIADVVEWIRRGLALNRGALFAALLCVGDPCINERLAPHRLTLTLDEITTVCRRVAVSPGKPTLKFLRNWRELLATDTDRPDVAAISAALLAANRSRRNPSARPRSLRAA